MKIVSMVFCCVLLWIQSSGQSCTISSASTNISCYGSNDGTAEVVVSGGGSGGASNCSSPQAPGVNDDCTTGCNTTVTTNTNVTVTLGQKVCIKANVGRNKCEYKEGILTSTYSDNFTVACNVMNSTFNLNYSYREILTNDVMASD